MKIRLINATPFFRGWNGHLPGSAIDIAGGVANVLIDRGVAKTVAKKQKGRKRAGHKR